MDFPTLLIRDATKKNGFYKRVFEHGHFNLKDAHEWGYVINSEDIGEFLTIFCDISEEKIPSKKFRK